MTGHVARVGPLPNPLSPSAFSAGAQSTEEKFTKRGV